MWSNSQETADLVSFTGEIVNGKLHFRAQKMNDIWNQWVSKSDFILDI